MAIAPALFKDRHLLIIFRECTNGMCYSRCMLDFWGTANNRSIWLRRAVLLATVAILLGSSGARVAADDTDPTQAIIQKEEQSLAGYGDEFVAGALLAVYTDPRLFGQPAWRFPAATSKLWRPQTITPFNAGWPYWNVDERIKRWTSPVRIWVADRSRYEDEIALLVDAFNNMLQEMEAQNRSLVLSRQEAEKSAEEHNEKP